MSAMDLRLWIIFASLAYVIEGVSISDYVKPCEKNHPNLDKCALDATNQLRPRLKKGLKSLRIPPLDPMVIPRIEITNGAGGPVSLQSTFTDVHVEGISAYEMRKIHIDLDKREIRAEAFVPVLSTKGKYNMSGKILALPISGSGDSQSKYYDLTALLNLKLKPEMRNGKEFWVLDKSDFDIDVQRADIRLQNLFNGNKQLGDTMNTVINENWKVVFQELKPTIIEAVNTLVTDLAKKFFNSFPADELFPQ